MPANWPKIKLRRKKIIKKLPALKRFDEKIPANYSFAEMIIQFTRGEAIIFLCFIPAFEIELEYEKIEWKT